MTAWMPGLVWTRSTTGQPGCGVDTIGGQWSLPYVLVLSGGHWSKLTVGWGGEGELCGHLVRKCGVELGV